MTASVEATAPVPERKRVIASRELDMYRNVQLAVFRPAYKLAQLSFSKPASTSHVAVSLELQPRMK